MTSQTDFGIWVAAWLGVAIVIFIRHARVGRSVGLLLCYLLSLATLHWFAAALMLLPWATGIGLEETRDGLRQSVFALIGLGIGAELVAAKWRRTDEETESGPAYVINAGLVNLFIIGGGLLYATLFTSFGQMATLRALASTGSTLLAIGVGLNCWNAYRLQRWASLTGWVALTVVFPFVTVFVQGFLGYGLAAMAMVLTFIAGFHRPKIREVVIAILLAYIGLSIYVTYMRDRAEIRELVWYGASTTDRWQRLRDTLALIEWFDPRNHDHMVRVEVRLNQNYLVGASVAYLESAATEYAHGSTVWDAALAIIPRALWPDKHVAAGSGDLVSRYTGIVFGEDTSVGVGQVLECYINFGTSGVVVGFILLGAIVAGIDRRARAALDRRQPLQFLVWYLPGLSLLQVGGSLSEVTATALASWVVAFVFSRLVHGHRQDEETPVSSSLIRTTS